MNKANFKYNAFISYSQDPDKKLAREMEDRLEKFGIGWHRLKKQQLYIFRDATDLSLTHDLGAKIKEGLEQSEFLILLAQKKLSLSALNWVNQEVGYFLKLCEQRQVDPSDYIILVITDGEIEWDRKENNWNFEKTNVLPNALQNIYVAQPLYVDLRILKDSISYGIQKQALNEALVVIEARLLKKKPSEIQDMVIRLQQIVIAFTFVVAAVLLGLAIFSFIQKNKASENEKKAKHNQQIADREKKKAMNQSIIALHESTKAIYASIETRNEARKAEKERNNAKAEKDTADQQRDTANKRKKEAIDAKNLAIVQKGKADTAKYQTDTLNKLLEAENLSIIYANLVSKVNRKDRKIMKDDTDSILLAYELFNSYFNRNRKDHYRKIESIYTALHQAYIINENTERTFPVNYSHLFIAENNNVYLLNRSGNILQLSLSLMQSNKNLEGFKGDTIYEITPVVGSNYIVYSLRNNDWEVFDILKQRKVSIEKKNSDIQSIVTATQLNREDHTFYITNKKGYLQKIAPSANNELEVQSAAALNENIVLFSQTNLGVFLLSNKGKITAFVSSKDCNVPDISNSSFLCTGLAFENIFIGKTDGSVGLFNIKTSHFETIAQFQNRINKILWSDKQKILIIQEGAKNIALFKLINNRYIRILTTQFGSIINDLTLDNIGTLYILYDNSKLQWWKIDDKVMADNIRDAVK